MDWGEIVSVASDITVAMAVLFTAWVANRGLNTWRLQMKGKNEYKLARDLLVSLYKYRDAICDIRQPWSGFPGLREDSSKIVWVNDAGKQKELFARILPEYQKKWDNIVKQKQRIYRDVVVAEALWGNELHQLFNQLFEQGHTLHMAIKWYIKLLDPDALDDNMSDTGMTAEKAIDTLFIAISFNFKSGDTFGKKIMEDVKSIEQYLKKKLETTLAG